MNRKQSDKWTIFLIVVCLLLAFGLAGLAFGFWNLQNRYEDTKKQWEKKEKEYEQRLKNLEKLEAEPTAESSEVVESDAVATKRWESLEGVKPGYVVDSEVLDMSDLSKYFNAYPIEEGDAVYQRINGKSYRENPDIGLEDLSYLLMLHYDYAGQIRVGEMIVNKAVEADVRGIFQELFENQYQIQSMYLVDNYWEVDGTTADSISIDNNNTSAFNYREATDSDQLSNHAFGRAIDINPLYNPYVLYDEAGIPIPPYSDEEYNNRATGREITHEGVCYEIFTKYGFTWGGDWVNPIDYQHFEKRA